MGDYKRGREKKQIKEERKTTKTDWSWERNN